jgi:signal transduction histidine kinase
VTFRTRLIVACSAIAVVPLAVFAIGVRREMGGRLESQYRAEVSSLTAVTRDQLAYQGTTIGTRLATVRDALADDNRFRIATTQGSLSERPYVLDYAAQAMRLTGLSMLQIQDESGRILSSGHFRNEYDRLEPDLPLLLGRAPGSVALVQARTPDGPLLVLARVDSLRLGGHRLTVVGGVAVDSRFLAALTPDSVLAVSLVAPAGEPIMGRTEQPPAARLAAASADVVGELPYPWIASSPTGPRTLQSARFVISHPTAELAALRRRLDRWFLAMTVITAVAAVLLAAWLAARVSHPLSTLAAQTARLDLDRLDVDFTAGRDDEIGALSRLLRDLTQRLRGSVVRLREAERRATVGDVARQVHHDIKNGLVPLRHVLRHLAQVERADPERLAAVFVERRPTLEASVSYLDALARRYARLTPRIDRAPCDANAVARAVAVGTAAATMVAVRLRLDPAVPTLAVDALVLRRVLENLVTNAVDAVGLADGAVTIATDALGDGGVRLTIADTGRGMTQDELTRAFDDFYTTKTDGSGLGLSIVRRLVADLGAVMQVESVSGAGTRVSITLASPDASPAASAVPTAVLT